MKISKLINTINTHERLYGNDVSHYRNPNKEVITIKLNSTGINIEIKIAKRKDKKEFICEYKNIILGSQGITFVKPYNILSFTKIDKLFNEYKNK